MKTTGNIPFKERVQTWEDSLAIFVSHHPLMWMIVAVVFFAGLSLAGLAFKENEHIVAFTSAQYIGLCGALMIGAIISIEGLRRRAKVLKGGGQ